VLEKFSVNKSPQQRLFVQIVPRSYKEENWSNRVSSEESEEKSQLERSHHSELEGGS
jgi:hypothetical protein